MSNRKIKSKMTNKQQSKEEIEEIKSRHEQELSVLNGTVETLSNKASKASPSFFI